MDEADAFFWGHIHLSGLQRERDALLLFFICFLLFDSLGKYHLLLSLHSFPFLALFGRERKRRVANGMDRKCLEAKVIKGA